MSQHFFCRLGLAILFISTNVLPMQEDLLKKNLVNSKNNEKKEPKNVVARPSFPLSTPYLKQQSIALESNKHNLYSLIFNRNEQPCITHYLLNGNQVAQLTQISDEINFESKNNNTHDFSLQIPYQAGSSTFNTQGKLVFDKKITAYSAYITGKKIDFLDHFFSKNELSVEADRCKTYAPLTCSDFLFNGKKFKIAQKSSLISHNSLTLTATSSLSNEGTVDCKKDSLIRSALFKNIGTFGSHHMSFSGNKIINEGDLRIRDSFNCASKIFEQSGMLDVLGNFIIEKGDMFSSTPSSVININGDWKSFITSFYLQGSLSVKDLFLTGKNFSAKSPFHCIAENAQLKMEEDVINEGALKVLGLLDIDSKNIKLAQTSTVTAENANLKTRQAIENDGNITVKNHLSGRTRSISNKGKFQINSGDIKADRYFYNAILSQLNVKNSLTINTPLSINLLGLTNAQYATINSIIGLNALGIYAAKNLSINSLFSVNAGLLLPKFSSFAEMYSWQNLRGLGESLFIKHVPFYGTLYSTLKNIQGLYQQGRSICSEIGSIYKQRGIGASDFIALICLAKSMMSSAQQTSNLGQQSYSLLSNISQNNKPQNIEISPSFADKAKDIAQQMPSTLLSHYGSSVTTNAAVDRNYGVAVGINSNTSSLYSYNENTSLYVNNNINTYSGENTGCLGALNLNIKATNTYDSDGNIAVSDANIDVYRLQTKGPINAHKNLRIRGTYTNLDGDVTADEMYVKSYSYSSKGALDVSNGIVDADYLDSNGPINAAKNVLLKGQWSANIKGDINAENIAIKSDGKIKNSANLNSFSADLDAKRIEQNGNITASENVFMKGDNIDNLKTVRAKKIIITEKNPDTTGFCARRNRLYNGGNLLASEVVAADARNIDLGKNSHVSGENIYYKSGGYVKNDGTMDTQQLVINAQQEVENSAPLNIPNLHVTSQSVLLKETSDITAQNAYFKINGNEKSGFRANDDWKNAGKLKTEQLAIDTPKDVINSGNIAVSEFFHTKARNVHLKETSDIYAKNSFFQVNSLRNNGGIKSIQCSIDAQQNVINNSEIDASESLQVNAQNIFLEKGSKTTTKDAYCEAKENVNLDGTMEIEKGTVKAGGKVTVIGKIGASKKLGIEATNIALEKTSDVFTKNADLKAKHDVSCDGKMSLETAVIDAERKVKIGGNVNASNQLDVINAQNIAIEKTANVSAKKAHLIAKETISNGGNFSADELYAHAKYVENSGNINVGKARIKADRYFWNQCRGSVHAQQELIIDAAVLLNIFADIRAQNLQTNSIINANIFGAYRGDTISQNSIIGFNTGAIIPTLDALSSLKKSVTLENAWTASHMAVTQILPKLVSCYLPQFIPICAGLKFGFNAARLGYQAYKLYENAPKLYETATLLYNKKDLCLSDTLPFLCDSKNLIRGCVQAGYQGYELASQDWQSELFPQKTNHEVEYALSSATNNRSAASILGSQLLRDYNKKNETIPIFSTCVSIAKTTAASAASILGPQLSRDCLVDINTGLMLGVNASSQSLYNANFGASLFANNNSISTISGINAGVMGAGNVSVNALQSYSSNGMVGADSVSMIANNLAVTGKINTFSETLLKAHENAIIDAKIKSYCNTTTIDAKKLHLKDNSEIDANSARITAQSIKGEKGNTITTRNGTIMKANKLDNSGTTNGQVGLDFGGKESDLKSIGNVKDITYSGTLDNGLADRLANGHNSLLSVENGGSIAIAAGQQNVHLKEQHDMGHTLHVQTGGSIKCDKNLSSEKSTILQAKGDIDHECVESQETTALMGKNISSQGHVTRQKHGDNYKDVATESKVSGKQVIIAAENDLNYKGTHVHSGTGGTQAYIGNNLHSDTLELEERSTSENRQMGTHRKNKEQSFTKQEDTFTTHAPNTFSSEGKTEIRVRNTAHLGATVFNSADGTTIEAGLFVKTPVYDTHTQKVEARTRKFMGKENTTTESYTETLRPIEFKEKTPPTIISGNPVSLHLKCDAPSITIDAPKVELLLPKTTTIKDRAEDNIHGNVWDRAQNKKWRDTVHGPSYNGTLNTNAESIHIQDSENGTPTIVNPTSANPSITRSLVKDIHEYHKEVTRSRPTPLLINTAALITSAATQGLGASLGIAFKAALAGINAFGLNAAHTFLQCDGNYKDAAKQMLKPQALRAIATAALISAATLGADQGLNKFIPQLSQATTLMQRLLYTAPREIVRSGIGCAGDIALGKNPKEAIKDNTKSAAANILGSALSSQIGQLYGDKKIDPITHKLLHASVGAAEGAVVNGKNGAIAGAIGAGVAETVADIACPKPPSLESILRIESQLGRSLTKNEFAHEWNKQTLDYLKRAQSVGNASKIMGAAAATLANQDINTAYNTATKAVDHNFLPLVGGAIVGISAGYSAYKIHKTYQEEGTVEALKYLGIEVVSNIAAVGASKVLFKFGNHVLPSAKTAVNMALDTFPDIKLVLGNTAETLITGAQLLARTGVVKKAALTTQKLIDFDNKISNKIESFTHHIASKFEKQINPSLAEDLVEQLVPASVLNNTEKQLAKQAAKESAQQLALPTPKKTPLLPAPLKTNHQNTQLSKAKRELTKKPAGNIPKYTSKEVDKSAPASKGEKSLGNKPVQDGPKPLAQHSLDEIKPAVIAPDSVLQQDVSLSMKEFAQQEIIKARDSLSILEKNVERFRNTVSHEKVGEILNIEMSWVRIDKLETEAKNFYNFIRGTNDDINAIAKNTGISEEILNQIKNHVFIEEHILRDNAIMRFHPCVDMAAAWKRLMTNNFVYSDLVLLQHELAESFAMQGTKIPYNIAHPLVNKIYNWENAYK